MKDVYVNVTATRAYCGVILQRSFLSPFSLVLYILLLVPAGRLFLITNNIVPLVASLFVISFSAHVVSAFNCKVLLSDKREELAGRNVAHALSADMVRALSRQRKLNAQTLLRAAVSTPRGKFVLSEIGISQAEFLAQLRRDVTQQIDLLGFLVRAKELQKKLKERRIDANVILYYFFQHGGAFKDLLNEKDLSQDDLRRIMQWERFHFDWREEVYTWSPRNLLNVFGMFGRSWATGYTDELDRLTTDISEKIYFKGAHKVSIQQKEIDNIMHVLGRSAQQNVMIIGKPGVGKSTMIENMAYRLRKHEVEHSLSYTRVLKLHTEELLSGTMNPDAFLLTALKRADKGGRFILVIEDIAVLLQTKDTKLLNVINKFLNAPNVSAIGICDIGEYHTIMKNNAGIDRLFEKIYVDDASDEETMLVMMTHYFRIEEKRHMHITFKALKSILKLTKRYINKGGYPGKAISVLEDAMMATRRRGDTFVTETDVREIISLKAHMDIRDVSDDERERLLSLESALRRQIIGQDDALRALVNTLKRARMDIHSSKKPYGTFLFLGPTGVGKTETAKVLAHEYFGSAENMIRLDMNEFSTEDSVGLIVGAPDASAEVAEGYLARRVQDRPFSLVLLDEIEKAHPKVLNIFLQILDEGMLTDSMGMSTDFRNTVIIATSNAGALFIRDFVKEHRDLPKEQFKQELIDAVLKQNIFSPEFINRFDDVMIYEPLSEENALKVAVKMIDEVIHDLRDKRGVNLKMEEGVVSAIAKKGYSQEFGAREMRRTVTEIVENYIADYLLKNDVKRGDEIFMKVSDLHIDSGKQSDT